MQEWNQKGLWTLAERAMHQKISEYFELKKPPPTYYNQNNKDICT